MPKKKSSNKEKLSSSTTNEPISPNLPQHLIKSIFEKHRLHDHISFPGTTKSWHTTSKLCNKQLQYPQLAELPDSSPIATSSSLGRRYNWVLPGINGWNPTPPPGYPKTLFETSRSWYLTPNQTILTLTGVPNPAFVVHVYTWKGSERRWITHESTTIDPYDAKNQVMKFTNVVMLNDKFYALSLQGSLVVMEDKNDDAKVTITGICRTRAVPCSANAKYFKEYLFKSKGDILLIFLICQKSITVVDRVEVFRLDFGRLELVEVDRMEGRALFLDKEYCIWADSRDIGCKGDCVYFTGGLGDGWSMYDMETKSISAESIWDEPTGRLL